MKRLASLLLFIFVSAITVCVSASAGEAPAVLSIRKTSPLTLGAQQYSVPTITFTGAFASQSAKDATLKQAEDKFPLAIINDETKLNEDGIDSTAGLYAVQNLYLISNGEITISHQKILSINGQSSIADINTDFLDIMKNAAPHNVKVGQITLTPPAVKNFSWSVNAGSANVDITGFVPSINDKKSLLAIAKDKFPTKIVTDSTVVAEGAPSNFFDAAKVGLDKAAEAEYGSVRIVNEDFSQIKQIQIYQDVDLNGIKQKMYISNLSDVPSNYKIEMNNIRLAPLTPAKDKSSVEFLFATDRIRSDKALAIDFNGERSEALTYGAIRVHIPDVHRMGNIELPKTKYIFWNFFPYKEAADPAKHFMIASTNTLTLNDWKEQIAASGDDALVFVHGFNTSFEDSAYRFAQVIWDLQYKGHAILFTWPSRGDLLDYEYDRNSALFAREHFAELIRTIQSAGIKNVHVLAHSMGNFLVVDALSNYARTSEPIRVSQLIMAAPDIDTDEFKQDVGNLRKVTSGMTLYASSNDAAIILSKTLAQAGRAADVLDGQPVIAQGVDSIDVSAIGSETLGLSDHDMFAANRSLIDDIALVLKGLRPPNARLPEIRAMPEGSATARYWRYSP